MYNNDLKEIVIKLDTIQSDIVQIKNGIRRNDTHNSFISKLYLLIKKPILDMIGVQDEDEIMVGGRLFIKDVSELDKIL